MNHVVNKLFNSLKISKHDRVELKKFIDQPDIQKILNSDEVGRIARSRELIAQKTALPAKYEKAIADAEKVAVAAVARFDAAETEFYAARKARSDAWLVCSGIKHSLGMEIKAIDEELRAAADPRLVEYRAAIGNLESRARVADKYWMGKEERETEGMFNNVKYVVDVLMNNMEDVNAARDALENVRIDLEAMQLAAMTTAEVTAALRKMTDDLIPVLNKLNGINPPWIDEFNEVRPPNEDGKPAYPHPLDAPQY